MLESCVRVPSVIHRHALSLVALAGALMLLSAPAKAQDPTDLGTITLSLNSSPCLRMPARPYRWY